MNIKRIRIENYHSIKACDFEPSNLCAFIGSNHRGKSVILRAINLVLGESWPSVRGIDERDFYGYDETRDIQISIGLDEQREVKGDLGSSTTFRGVRFTGTRDKKKSGTYERGDLRAD